MVLKKNKINENSFLVCYALARNAENLDNTRGNWRRISTYMNRGNAELDEFIQALIHDTCNVEERSVTVPNVDKLTLQFETNDLDSDIILLAPEEEEGYRGRTYSESTHALLEAIKGYWTLKELDKSKTSLFRSIVK